MRSKAKPATHHAERSFISMALAGGFYVLPFITPATIRTGTVSAAAIITAFPIAIRGHEISCYRYFGKSLRHASCKDSGIRGFVSACLHPDRPGVLSMLGNKTYSLRSGANI